MKKTGIMLITGLLICCNYNAMAQKPQKQKKQTEQQKMKVRQLDTPKAANNNYPGKSINEGTEGVLGKDTIRLNERGMELNQNYNTGTPIPPSNGNNPKK